MKKWIVILLCVLLMLAVCGCQTEPQTDEKTDSTLTDSKESVSDTEASEDEVDNEEDGYRDHQELTVEKAPFDADAMLRVSLPEVGLKNVLIQYLSSRKQLDNKLSGRVYLLADDRYGGPPEASDHYLAVAIDGDIIVKDIAVYEDLGNYDDENAGMELCDFDGDGDCEILLQQLVSLNGGAGGYISRVFDIADGEIKEVFSSEDPNTESLMDTGFSIEILPNKEFKIEHSIIGYSEVFRLEDRLEEYYTWLYDENGNPKPWDMLVDSFYEFVPKDVDGDGVYEIRCRQYVSLTDHTDWIGDAITVWKYNTDKAAFEIIQASFESCS